MTTGFEVRRSDGKVSVSSTYPHYSFIKKIRGTGNFWDTSGYQYTDHVLVAFIPVTYGTNTQSSYRFSKGSMLLWGYAGHTPPPPNATLSLHSSVPCDAYVFDIRQEKRSTGYGLVVMNIAGEVTFDTAARYMRVVDVIQGLKVWSDEDQNGDAFVTYTYPQATKIAVVPLKFAYANSYSSSSEEQWYSRTWESIVDKNTLRITMVTALEDYFGSTSGSTSDLNYLALVIDVSNTELI